MTLGETLTLTLLVGMCLFGVGLLLGYLLGRSK